MSKSMPVEWHRECLKNIQQFASDLESELSRYVAAKQWHINRVRGCADLLLRQITEAERRGKTEFDADRYLVKRVKKDAAE